MEMLAAEDLSFSYPNSSEQALKNISLSVAKGEFVLLCGPSGCGKSTLLKHFKSVLTPNGTKTGTVKLCGKPLQDVPFREQSSCIGFVWQSPDDQIVTDKVWHELAFGLENLGLANDVIRRRTAETAAFFGIENWYEQSVEKLSGGQKQLLNLASVMVMQPSLLILDEPSSQLDPIAAGELLSAVGKINRELGVTVIMTEHRLDEVMPLADRVVVMENGSIAVDLPPKQLGSAAEKISPQMSLALPAVMRIWLAADGRGDCPVTTAQGRNWLEERSQSCMFRPVQHSEFIENGEPVLSAKDIWFSYERSSKDVLRGAEVKLYRSEILGILGGNGAGKSTLLSVLSGCERPYRGKVSDSGHKVGVLPQDPRSLFVRSTVAVELHEITDNEDKIRRTAALCRLETLLQRSPFDLSGGEQQRAALAKVLLTGADILLLDEPTKGVDAAFKKSFGRLLQKLAACGKAVIIVSHDADFCAEFCHRCVMLFNGETVSEDSSVEFFSDSSFYTTSTARMSRGIIEKAVTAEQVMFACGADIPEYDDPDDNDGSFQDIEAEADIPKEKKKRGFWRRAFRCLSFAVLLLSVLACLGNSFAAKLFGEGNSKYFLLAASAVVFSLLSNDKSSLLADKAKPRKVSKKTAAVAAVMYLAAVPLTAFVGAEYLADRKYLFISLLIMFECMLPFFLAFESRCPQARELVLTASLCAIAVAGRAAFYMLPQFKPVMAVVIISGAALGCETGFLVGAVSMFASNIFFGQGPWTPWQMFAMGIVGALAGLIFDKARLPAAKGSLALFGLFSAVVIYGGIMNPSTLVTSGIKINKAALAACYAAGLPMDIVHGAATMIFLYVGAQPLIQKLEHVRIKYGII